MVSIFIGEAFIMLLLFLLAPLPTLAESLINSLILTITAGLILCNIINRKKTFV